MRTKSKSPKKKKIQEPNKEVPTTSEELRKAQAGLLTIHSVLYDARNPDRKSISIDDKIIWHSWLTLTGEFGEFARRYNPPVWDTISATGVSVVERQGAFYTEYYLPGKSDNAVRRTTHIPLSGMRAPLNEKGQRDVSVNPLWWWDSPHYLEILEKVEEQVRNRFSEYDFFMMDVEAAQAALAVWPFAERCLLHVQRRIENEENQNSGTDPIKSALRVFDAPRTALIKCTPIFKKFGIDLPTLIRSLSFPSITLPPKTRKFDPNVPNVETRLIGAAFDLLEEPFLIKRGRASDTPNENAP